MILTVCFVVYNEEKHFKLIEQNLKLLAKFQSHIDVLLIDNGSYDGTGNFLKQMSKKYSVQYIARTFNHLAEARQHAVLSAKTDWVGFVDADCRLFEYWPNYVLSRLNELSANVAAIGGPWVIGGEWSYFYRSLFSTFLGNFGLEYLKTKQQTQSKSVFHLPTANIVYKRQALLLVGGFNCDYDCVGEDLDMSQQLTKNGYCLLFEPRMNIMHFLPNSWHKWCFKMYSYGNARAIVAWKFKQLTSYTFVLPLLFVSFLVLNFALMQIFGLKFFLIYLLICAAFCLLSCHIKSFPYVFMLMVLTHFFYGLGLALGILREIFASLWIFVQLKNRELKKKPPKEGLDNFRLNI